MILKFHLLFFLLFAGILGAAPGRFPLRFEGSELFGNPGFEQSRVVMEQRTYEEYGSSQRAGETTLTGEFSRSGKQSLCFTLPVSGGMGRLYSSMGEVAGDIPEELPVTYTGFLYVDTFSGEGSFHSDIQAIKGDIGRGLASVNLDLAVLPRRRWIPFSAHGTARPGERLAMRLSAVCNSPAKLYIDDLSVKAGEGTGTAEKPHAVFCQMIPQSLYAGTPDENKLFISPEDPCVMRLSFGGDRTNAGGGSFTVILPEKVNFSAFGNYHTGGYPQPNQALDPEIIQSNGRPAQRFTWQISDYLWSRKQNICFYFFFEITPQDAISLSGQKITWELSVDGQKASGETMTIEVVSLPKVQIPDHFPMYTFYSTVLNFDTPDGLQMRNFKKLSRLGLRGVLSARYNADSASIRTAFKTFDELCWTTAMHCSHHGDFIPGLSEHRLLQADRKVLPIREGDPLSSYCPQFLIDHMHLGQFKVGKTGNKDVTAIYLDYEPYGNGRPTTSFCFCPLCVKTFAAEFQLPETIAANDIGKAYSKEWVLFRERQQARLLNQYFTQFINAKPGVHVFYCTLPESPDSSFASVRNRLIEDTVDFFTPMTYLKGTRLFDSILYNCRSTRKAVLPMLESTAGLRDFHSWSTPWDLDLALMSIAAAGGQGVSFYAEVDFDAKYMAHMLATLNRIRRCQKFYQKGVDAKEEVTMTNHAPTVFLEVDGKKVAAETISIGSLRSLVHRLNGQYLITLLNFNQRKEAWLKMAIPNLPEGQYRIADPGTQRHYPSPNNSTGLWDAANLKIGFPFKVEPYRYAQILVEVANRLPDPANAAASLLDPEQSGETAILEPRLAQMDMAISRTDRLGDGRFSVKLETPAQTLWIDLEDSAKLEQWFIKSAKRNLIAESRKYTGRRCGAVKDVFDIPAQFILEADWTVVERKISHRGAEIMLQCEIEQGPLHGFAIQKTYLASPQNPEILVSYRIQVNRDDKDKADFKFRIHNEFDFSLAESELGNLQPFAWYLGKKSAGALQHDLIWGKAEGIFAGNAKNIVGAFDGTRFGMQSHQAGKITATFTAPEQLQHLFAFRPLNSLPTFEWFYHKTNFPQDPHVARIWETSFILKFENP